MRVLAATFIGALCAFGSSLALRAATEPPAWAYAAVNTPAPAAAGAPAGAPPAANTTPRSLPGSTLTFPPAQIRDAFGPAADHVIAVGLAFRGVLYGALNQGGEIIGPDDRA